MDVLGAIIFLVVSSLAFWGGWKLRAKIGQDRISRAEEYATRVVNEAQQEAEDVKKARLLDAEEEILKLREKLHHEERERLQQFKNREKKLSARETNLDRKVDILNNKEKKIFEEQQEIERLDQLLKDKSADLDQLILEQSSKLKEISGLTVEEAKKIQLDNVLDLARQEASFKTREIIEMAKESAEQKSKEIIVQAIERSGVSHVVDATVSPVSLPADEMKGRIIGREGRNIRTFEAATGVEVLIDDTPGLVMLSGFDPIRREVAKLALEKLIYDGRIHPGRIEEVIDKTRQEIDEKIFEYGEEALVEVGLHSLHHELVKLIGQLKFHTGQGQNLLQHSIEVATLAGLMASDLELDTKVAKRAGLLHEIGNAIDAYTHGTTSELSADLAKKYGENEEVLKAIAFANKPPDSIGQSLISVLVASANEISMYRPGAVKEDLQSYFDRLRNLEQIANSLKGVTQSYAIQAGKEIRVIAGYDNTDDSHPDFIASSISGQIKDTLSYPGQIKVSVIREYRTFGYAK